MWFCWTAYLSIVQNASIIVEYIHSIMELYNLRR